MTTTDAPEPGLRERKRLATRRAIQVAVLELVRDRGLDAVTVDEISRGADVSPRTFFNYFTSKEEAIIGEPPALPAADLVDVFLGDDRSGDVLSDVGRMLADAGVAEGATYDIELVALRRDLMKQYPQLFALRMATMRAFEDELDGLVRRRLTLDDPTLAGDPDELEQRARLITLVAFAGMRHAWSAWANHPTSPIPLSDRLRSSFEQLGALLVTAGAK
jgi:AcrR family transcriptional regulator